MKILDMDPRLSCANALDMSLGQAGLLGYAIARHPRFSQRSDTQDIRIGEPRHPMIRPFSLAAFPHAVMVVLQGCSQKQMGRITARGIVAAVAAIQFAGINPKCKIISRSVDAPLTPPEKTLSIPRRMPITLPRPTSIGSTRLVNPRPKPVNLFGSKIGMRHFWTSLSGLGMRRAGGAPTLPGFSLPKLYQTEVKA